MMKHKILILFTIAGSVLMTGCEKYFAANSDDILVSEEYISSVNEFYSGFIGLAAKVQDAADQTILLSGLRSDLLEPTNNAPTDLWDIYNFNEQIDNAYANPKAFYDIIVNANNYINKATTYNDNNPGAVDPAIYEGLVSGALRYKIWAYLQLGKLYDEVAFFDDNLVSYKDISGFQRLKLSDGTLIAELKREYISGMELENGKRSLFGLNDILWDDFLYPDALGASKDLTWNMICPLPEMISMELDLWSGNYSSVISQAMKFLYEEGVTDTRKLMLTDKDYNNEWIQFWSWEPVRKTAEVINVVPYDYTRHQTNRLLDHFSNLDPAKYLLRPTKVAMDRFYAQTRLDGATKKDRYRGENKTFGLENGEWTIKKYTIGRENEVYKNNPHIVLYRASDVHLWLAESCVHLGYLKEAEAFFNNGVQEYLSKYFGNYDYPLNDDVTNSAFALNWGVRRRVDLAPVYPATYTKDQIEQQTDEDSVQLMTETYQRELLELMVDETLMESAVEGRGHPAMVRMALALNDYSIIADRVSAKYPSGQKEAIQGKLMEGPANWFIKFDLSGLESD